MVEKIEKVAKVLGVSATLPPPVATAVAVVEVVAVASALLDELSEWDWPWSS